MRWLRVVAVSVCLAALLAPGPVQAGGPEILIHQNTFSGDMPAGWNGHSKDLRYDDPTDVEDPTATDDPPTALEEQYRDCEWKRRTDKDGNFHQMVWPRLEDECPAGRQTYGAPREGDLSMYRKFEAFPGEVYKGWARASTWNATSSPPAFAQVKIIFFKSDGGFTECYGRSNGTGEQVFGTDQKTFPNDPALMTGDGGCIAPAKTVSVHFHFRLHVEAPVTVTEGTTVVTKGASGDAVLDAIKFGRCGTDCSNVSRLPISS